MKERFWLIKHRGIFYLLDSTTSRRESLHTRSRKDAEKILLACRQATEQPSLNLALGKAFLAAHDQQMPKRTWGAVMDKFCRHGKPQTQERNKRAMEGALRVLRDKKLVETTVDDFRAVLRDCRISTHHFLRRIHNLALHFGWLPWPVMAPKLWDDFKATPKPKLAITWEQYKRIVEAEKNTERRLFYELLWETGAAQSDGASLTAANIDWRESLLSFQRQKTEQ